MRCTCLVSHGVKELPDSIPPASLEREFEVVASMITELNEKYAVITSIRNRYGSSESLLESEHLRKKIRIVMVGASHASRTALKLMEHDEAEVVDLTEGGWRPTEDNVFRMKEDLEGVLNSDFSGPTLVVFHLLDNSIYIPSQHKGRYQAHPERQQGRELAPGGEDEDHVWWRPGAAAAQDHPSHPSRQATQ